MGDRGIFGGGGGANAAARHPVIEYITISSTGNATSFGELAEDVKGMAGVSNGINERGIFAGGYNMLSDDIQYITISSTGNSATFGDLTEYRNRLAGVSNGINDRGVFAGGWRAFSSGPESWIDYITISSTGNATSFGDLSVEDRGALTGTSNGSNERGVFAGGGIYAQATYDVIDYITINSTGNATDFGDLSSIRYGMGGFSNGTVGRGIFGGGTEGGVGEAVNIIEYVTISILSNATDFGDLSAVRFGIAGTSNGKNDRGIFAGGNELDEQNDGLVDTIEYITISSTGNATDFGNLSSPEYLVAGLSNAEDRFYTTKWQAGVDISNMRHMMTIDRYIPDGTTIVIHSLESGGMFIPVFVPTPGDRGIFGGWLNAQSSMEYITISTPGNSIDFGDLASSTYQGAGLSNGYNNRGIICGGQGTSDNIDYITISSIGNATYFGDLNQGARLLAGASNGTNERGIIGGGYESGNLNSIEYITINSTGNGTDFGDLTAARRALGSSSNGYNERGVFSGGNTGARSDVIDYVTINSAGNATDFGDLTVARTTVSSSSNGINERGLTSGGSNASAVDVNTIDYITISTPSTCTDFGDLTIAVNGNVSTSNATNERGINAGGVGTDVIDYVTISTTGNASGFGDLLAVVSLGAGCSNSQL